MRPTALRALNRSRTCKASSSAASPLARLRSSPLSRHVKISEEVQDALHRGQPIVSLETAITSHGLPYDKAVHSADSLNKIIRGRGAVPAVIGLVDGVIKVGLSDAEVELLANPETSDPASNWKVGRRDLAPALVKGVHGGTTVSATSFLSHLVGIDVFVTGWVTVEVEWSGVSDSQQQLPRIWRAVAVGSHLLLDVRILQTCST